MANMLADIQKWSSVKIHLEALLGVGKEVG